MIFDYYLDRGEWGKPLRICIYCKNEWKNNDRRRLIDHMIGCQFAPTALKDELIKRDKEDALKKQSNNKQVISIDVEEKTDQDKRKRIHNWLTTTEEEFTRCNFHSSDDEQFEEGQPKDLISQEQKQSIDQSLVKWIYNSDLPVSIVEEPSFLEFIKFLRPAYYKIGLPNKADIATAIIHKSEERVKKVKKQMGGVDFLGQHSRNQQESFHQTPDNKQPDSSRDLGVGPSI